MIMLPIQPYLPALLVAAAVLLPLAMAAGFARACWRRPLGALVPWAALPALAAALWPSPGDPFLFEGVMLDLRMGVDRTGAVFLFLSSLLWLLSGWYARDYLRGDGAGDRFRFFWLLTMAGNFLLILAQDTLGFYAGFTLMSFSAYGLIIHDGEPASHRAGRIYIRLVVLGELLLFVGMLMLAWAAGGIAFGKIAGAPPSLTATLLLLAGFGIKAGALPLHFWLPPTYRAAPAPASAVLSGTMSKAGLLGWIRFLPDSAGVGEIAGLVIIAGSAAAFFGVAVGILQSHPKVVLAYSSISQMGFMTVGLGAALLPGEAQTAAIAAVAFYALHHGLAKGALFLGVGLSGALSSSRQRIGMRAGMVLAALAVAGAPLTSGASAKIVLKAGLASVPWPGRLDVMLQVAAIGSTLLMARVLWLIWSAAPEQRHARISRKEAMWLAWLALLMAAALFPWLRSEGFEAARVAFRGAYLWTSLWPVLVGAGLACLGGWTASRGSGRWWPVVPPGDLLAVIERAYSRASGISVGRFLGHLAHRASAACASLIALLASMSARAFRNESEIRLRAWENAGLILLLMSGLVLLSLAW